jgi:hypothetical protein
MMHSLKMVQGTSMMMITKQLIHRELLEHLPYSPDLGNWGLSFVWAAQAALGGGGGGGARLKQYLGRVN